MERFGGEFSPEVEHTGLDKMDKIRQIIQITALVVAVRTVNIIKGDGRKIIRLITPSARSDLVFM